MTRSQPLRQAAVLLGLNLACVAILLTSIGHHPGPPVGGDFLIFWAATQLAWQHQPAAIYDLSALAAMQDTVKAGMTRHAGWFYPPLFLLLLMPLGLIAYVPAWLLFAGLGIGFYLWSLSRWLPPGLSALWLVAYPGLWLNLIAGQNGLYTLSLVSLAAWWLPTRPLRAGAAIGLLAMKPHLGLLVPFWLIRQRAWTALVASAAMVALFIGLCTAAFGTGIWAGFLHGLQHGSDHLTGGIPLYRLASIYGQVRLLGGEIPLALTVQGLVALPALAALARIWQRRADDRLALLAALAATTLLLSPYLFDYDTVWLLPGMLWLARESRHGGRRSGETLWLAGAGLGSFYPQFLLPVLDVPVWQPAPLLCLSLLWLMLRRSR